MTRSSFKVLLGEDATAFDKNLKIVATMWMNYVINDLPGRHSLVRELSELIGMEPSRTRRLLADLDIK